MTTSLKSAKAEEYARKQERGVWVEDHFLAGVEWCREAIAAKLLAMKKPMPGPPGNETDGYIDLPTDFLSFIRTFGDEPEGGT